MTVQMLAERLSWKVLSEQEPEREVTGGYTGDLLSWVMGRAQSGDCWITIMSNANIIAVATLADTSAVVLAEGVMPDAGVTELARQKGINLYSSEKSAYRLCAELSALL